MRRDNRFIAVRHELHRNAETGFKEHATAAIVVRELTAMGLEVTRGIGGTGVVGVLRNRAGGPMVGLRAELDALPMRDESGVEFASTDTGAFHGCGHDGHMAILLAAAARIGDRAIDGNVAFIFQPAEEGLGGARAMIADGLFDRFDCSEVYALHNDPSQPLGSVAICPGPAMAAADFFDIEIRGTGSHAAHPHQGVDPLLVGAAMVQGLQSIVSRNVRPRETSVLSVTQFRSGSAYNVIPGAAYLGGTIRALDGDVMDLLRRRLVSVVENTAVAYGAEADVSLKPVFSVLHNHPDQSAAVARLAMSLFGTDMVDPAAPSTTGSEDFAEMLTERPGCYVSLGQGVGVPLHNPRYRFADELVPIGAALLESIAVERIAHLQRNTK